MASAIHKKLFSVRNIVLGALIVVVFFGGTLYALNSIWPVDRLAHLRPTLEQVPPLQPITRTSTAIAPVAITHAAIRDALEAAAPRNLSGKRDNPLSQALGKL